MQILIVALAPDVNILTSGACLNEPLNVVLVPS